MPSEERYFQGLGMGGTVDPGADCLLPLVAVANVVAFKVITAGQAQELGMHRSHLFHQVGTEAIRAVLVRGRKERNQIEPDRGWVGDGQDQMIVGCSGDGAGLSV